MEERKHVRFDDDVHAPRPFEPRSKEEPSKNPPAPCGDLDLSLFVDSDNNKNGNEAPYSRLPNKTPFPAFFTDDFRNGLLNDIVTTASKSKKNFFERPVADLDFFTVPNSKSNFLQDDITAVEDTRKRVKECCSCCKSKCTRAPKIDPPHDDDDDVKLSKKYDKKKVSRKTHNTAPKDSHKTTTKQISNGLSEKRKAIMKKKQNYESDESAHSSEETEEGDQKSPAEPAVSDLYRIIMLQNEQLQLLQKRVDDLLLKNVAASTPPEPKEPPKMNRTEENVDSRQISIGVMTSFEFVVSSSNKQVDECVQTSRDGSNATAELSERVQRMTVANEEREVGRRRSRRSPLMSPPCPNVKDYSDSEEELDQPAIGWTFHNNFMNHVDQILHGSVPVNAHRKTYANKKPHAVDISTSKRVTFEEHNSLVIPRHCGKQASETSMHINKLAAKYLGNCEVVNKIHLTSTPANKFTPNNNCFDDFRNEMSFSTLQYMQKYQLLTAHNNVLPTTKRRFPYSHLKPACKGTSRILDITAIKQQPKLL